MSLSIDIYPQGKLLSDEFQIGEEIIIVSLSTFQYGEIDFINKAVVRNGMKLKSGYYGPQYVFHGYSHYENWVKSLFGKRVPVKYDDIENAPNMMFSTSPSTNQEHGDYTLETSIFIILLIIVALIAYLGIHLNP